MRHGVLLVGVDPTTTRTAAKKTKAKSAIKTMGTNMIQTISIPPVFHDTNDKCNCDDNYAGMTYLAFPKRQHDNDANDAQLPPHPTFPPTMAMSPWLLYTR
jgi:hypothetical protein